ncbi:MAG: adenylate/guanylate cyclase domain-containing protein, partial [Pseudomonadota bacterium]
MNRTDQFSSQSALEVSQWLLRTGRMAGDDSDIINAYAGAMLDAGVPITRMNIALRFANPLLAAVAIIWTPEKTQSRPIPRTMLSSSAYRGSPFEYVQENRTLLRRKLTGLDPEQDHATYLEQAAAGATEYLALVLEFGDGSAHSCSFTTSEPRGFTDEQAQIIWETRHALATALEPATMRRTTSSLLQTYLGDGPAKEVAGGTIERGAHAYREAVVMITDLRQFTWMSENWEEAKLLTALDQYFETVVGAVHGQGGDVLKFMGDGVLSIFVIDEDHPRDQQVNCAIKAARVAITGLSDVNVHRRNIGLTDLAMGIGLDVGSVTYGNIGSPDRLDFTVLGSAVNKASRIQDLCKALKEPILITPAVVAHSIDDFRSLGP